MEKQYVAICPRCEKFYKLSNYYLEYRCGCVWYDNVTYKIYDIDVVTIYNMPDINPIKCKVVTIAKRS